METTKTVHQEWVARRIMAVRERFSAYDALMERGVDSIPDDTTPTQIQCPFHGADNRPSARYYPRSGGKHDYVRCFKCRENWDSISLLSKYQGLRFMDALVALERRFHIQIPKRPEGPEIVEPAERGSQYVSDKWADTPRMISMMETKLLRIRDKCNLTDYIKFCRVLDAIDWDYEKIQKTVPAMTQALRKLMERMDEVANLPDDLAFYDEDRPDPTV